MAKIINVYNAAGEVVRVYNPANLRKDQDAEQCAKEFITGRRGYTYGAEGEEPVNEVAETAEAVPGTPAVTSSENVEAPAADESEVVAYSELTLAELKKEAEAREIKLPTKVTKAEVIQLLEKYDSEHVA